MAKSIKTLSRYIGGIGEYRQESTIQDSYAFGQSIDVRTDPQNITLLPRTIKESASIIQGLPKWGEHITACDITYFYDESGNIYSRDSAIAYTNIHTVPGSHGNGLGWFGEDNFLYYTSDTLIGRYGPMCSSAPTFVDDFFGSQGGTPLNTNSLDLESGSTQYASRADTATLSITGNLSMELWIKPESLPAAGATMTLVSKWTENGNIRSYKFGIGTVSNYFGDGSDGALTISSNTTEAPIDSACAGTTGTYTLSATNASFVAGQKVLIHQSQGTGAGNNQLNTIQSYTAGTITLVDALNATYGTGAQVRVVKQHTNVTINTGITYTAKAWNGTVGGILAFLANGTVTVTGTITASGGNGAVANSGGGSGVAAGGTGGGFRGGATTASSGTSNQGEGTSGTGSASTSANGNGGGGGKTGSSGDGASGGAGGNGLAGAGGQNGNSGSQTGTAGTGGSTSGSADLTTLTFGGGGGGGASPNTRTNERGGGGSGGGIVFMGGVTVTVTGSVVANGGNGGDAYWDGGAGAGGSILIKAQTATLGSSLITASGGLGGGTPDEGRVSGGDGRVHIDYLTSYTGTTTPTITSLQDTTLGSSSGYTLFLSVSSTGTNVETLTKPANIMSGAWQNVAVAWTASTSTAQFFLNGVSLGSTTGTLTAIHDNASTFNIGMDLDSASAAQHLYDGLIDEVRLFNSVRTADDILSTLSQHINVATAGLQGYWQFNSVATDATTNANNLTLTGSPVYSSDVPFPAPTTRLDIDVTGTGSGNTYALPAAISEAAADRQSFTPTKDPQKSIQVFVSAKGAGSGTWTLTVHDQYNNVMASKSVAKSALSTGNFEFVFDSVWRPLTNFTNVYHYHLTDSDATGTVKTTTSNDLSSSTFTTYYQFLVSDTFAHPVARMLQFLVILNERYLATYEATLYDPNRIIFPAGWNARCYGYWQEYLAIGMVRGDDPTNQDMGRIYFWDGIAPTYNFYVDVPQGGVTALLGTNGRLFLWAGYQGDMLVYQGGDSVERVRKMPFMDDSSTAITYPGAVTMWKGLTRWGGVGEGSSTSIYRGVYTHGSLNPKYPDILTFDYPISTGNTQKTDLRIGMCMTVNQKLLIGWSDGTGNGIDYVSSSNACYPYGTIEFLIDDDDTIWKEKRFNTYVGKFAPLATGQSVSLKYRRDDETVWKTQNTIDSSSVDTSLARFDVVDQTYFERQVALDIYSTSGVTPTIKGFGQEVDERAESKRV